MYDVGFLRLRFCAPRASLHSMEKTVEEHLKRLLSLIPRKYPTRLVIHRPSPTTTEYTVSNSKPQSTRLAQVSSLVNLLLRLIFTLGLLYLLITLTREILGSWHGCTPGHRGPLHNSAQQLGLLKTKQASWIVIALISLVLWQTSRRDSFSKQPSSMCTRLC